MTITPKENYQFTLNKCQQLYCTTYYTGRGLTF